MSSYPDNRHWAFLPSEWMSLPQMYLGLPLTALEPFVGNLLPNGRKIDAHGVSLGGAILPGDGFRRKHDAVKWALLDCMHANYYDVMCEVYGLFTPHLGNAARAAMEGSDARHAKAGIVPVST